MTQRKVAIILAAGKGTRMKSTLPKVMHPILGRPMIGHVVQTALDLACDDISVVVGYGREQIESYLRTQFPDAPLRFCVQEQLRGTGDAVRSARNGYAEGSPQVAVMCGDTPNLPAAIVAKAFETQQQTQAAAMLITAIAPAGTAYGRIVRGSHDLVEKIVEYKDADDATRAIREVNTGCYVFNGAFLRENIDALDANNAQNEFYVTDLIGLATQAKLPVHAIVADDIAPLHGINTRGELAIATAYARDARNTALMTNGVTLMDPSTTWVDVESDIQPDVVIEPNVVIRGRSTIATGAYIEANVRLEHAQIAAGQRVRHSHSQFEVG